MKNESREKRKERHFYAQRSPRGFSNETETYKFTSMKKRDTFVSQDEKAHTITSRQAHRNVNWKGDAMTTSYNSDMLDGDEILRERQNYEKELKKMLRNLEVQ